MNALDVIRADDVKLCEQAIKERQQEISPWVEVWQQKHKDYTVSMTKS